MGIFDFFRRKAAPKPTDELLELMKAMAELNAADGIDADQFPNGVGDFGYSVDNPVPTHTILGSHVYLDRLRWKGLQVTSDRIGSFGSDSIAHPIDGYRIKLADNTQVAVLYLSPYQRRNSERAPAGFSLDR